MISTFRRALVGRGLMKMAMSSKYCVSEEFYLCLPDKPVYLQKPAISNSLKGASGLNESVHDEDSYRQSPVLAPYSTLFVFDIPQPTSDEFNKQRCYVRSCLSCQKLYRRLCEIPELTNCIDFILGVVIRQGSILRQLFALVADDASASSRDSSVSSLIKRHAEENREAVGILEYRKQSESACWKLCLPQNTAGQVPQILEEKASTNPVQSPIFTGEDFSPVFHDIGRAFRVLDVYSECPEVKKLAEIAKVELAGQKSLAELKAMMKHPLVVVEGMDATGKTTLTQTLENKLRAARYSTPPPCLLDLRRFFDKLPEIVRRAYYSLGNYIVAQKIAAECQHRPVVMDRYWHSTAAYGIANETSLADLPPSGHPDYLWPSDLLQPTAVVFLTVSEDVRRERLGHRHDNEVTFEEKSLNKDRVFRLRLCEAYLRMTEPECMQVDASGPKEEVVELVLQKLQSCGIHLS